VLQNIKAEYQNSKVNQSKQENMKELECKGTMPQYFW
jgi:hypothetical protein